TKILLELYAIRHEIELDDESISWTAHHSLRSGAPVFWWLSQLSPAKARSTLEAAFNAARWRKGYVVTYAGFYGQRFYENLGERLQRAGHNGVRPFRNKHSLLNVGPSKHRE